MKKNLLKCGVVALFGCFCAVNVWAVDMLRTEDEPLLWAEDEDITEPELFEGEEAPFDELFGNQLGDNVEEVYFVPYSAPTAGLRENVFEALHKTAQKPQAEEPNSLAPRKNTPRTFLYPIGQERRDLEAGRREWYRYDLMKKKKENPNEKIHKALIKEYSEIISDCMENKKDQIELEIEMLSQRYLYENAAYLSQSLAEVEQCYDDIGLDIIDRFYNGDEEKMNEYRAETKNFHVVSNDVSFDARYCEENCSVKAIAELQLNRFDDFRTYLGRLLNEAPVIENPQEKPQTGTELAVPEEFIPLIDEAEFGAELKYGREAQF